MYKQIIRNIEDLQFSTINEGFDREFIKDSTDLTENRDPENKVITFQRCYINGLPDLSGYDVITFDRCRFESGIGLKVDDNAVVELIHCKGDMPNFNHCRVTVVMICCDLNNIEVANLSNIHTAVMMDTALTPLEHMHGLKVLSISELSDLFPYALPKGLIKLELMDASYSDISWLDTMETLTYLALDLPNRFGELPYPPKLKQLDIYSGGDLRELPHRDGLVITYK